MRFIYLSSSSESVCNLCAPKPAPDRTARVGLDAVPVALVGFLRHVLTPRVFSVLRAGEQLCKRKKGRGYPLPFLCPTRCGVYRWDNLGATAVVVAALVLAPAGAASFGVIAIT